MATHRVALVVLLGVAVSVGARAGEALPELQTGLPFPDKLGSLERAAEMTKYNTRPEGTGVRYNGPDLAKADIYVYNAGEKSLGTGQIGEAVWTHLEECTNAILELQKRGHYRDVKHLGDQQISLKAGARRLPMLDARFDYREVISKGTLHCRSHLLLTTYKDMYLKVRFTYMAANTTEGERALQSLLRDLGPVLAAHWDAPLPATPPLWITIVNPAKNSAPIRYTLDGNPFQIAPGQSQKLDYQYVIEFDQGTAKGTTSYTLDEDGVYRFARQDDGSWTLAHSEK